jgi:MoaA/NifB/PqqE/SkfB family radical SAM enzyme
MLGAVETRPQNRTLTGSEPLDRPSAQRPHRLYVAVTNHCNRACPWCSTCSSPAGQTFLSVEALRDAFPTAGDFEVQLEGGEPTVHPRFWELVGAARAEPRCRRLVIVTNGVRLPRDEERLRADLARLGTPLTLKLSINHHLLDRDPGLLSLASRLARLIDPIHAEFVLNVRLRRGEAEDDRAVLEAVEAAGLLPRANVFYLQRYGFAADRNDWEAPFVVGTDFTLVNPDGSRRGTDLVARSEAMRVLP